MWITALIIRFGSQIAGRHAAVRTMSTEALVERIFPILGHVFKLGIAQASPKMLRCMLRSFCVFPSRQPASCGAMSLRFIYKTTTASLARAHGRTGRTRFKN